MTVDSPYNLDGDWVEGNLHTHTTVSDGPCSVDETVRGYDAIGRDFLAISDHDTLVAPEEYPRDVAVEPVPAVEVSANGPHLLHVGATEAVDPLLDRSTVVDRIDEADGLAIAAHPKWGREFEHWSYATLEDAEGLTGVEIYNAHIETLHGDALATGVWDRLLSEGRRVWGFANDDTHEASCIGLAWNTVLVEEVSAEAILEALAAGRFYASTGVRIRSIYVDGSTIHVDTTNATAIRFVTDHGITQRTVDGPSATIRVPDQLVNGSDHSYVRIECVSARNEMAWTQPLFLS